MDVTFLSSIGQKISGTVEEVHQRAELFQNQPKLANRLEKDCEAKERNDRIFGREIRWDEVPASQERSTVGWSFPIFYQRSIVSICFPKAAREEINAGERGEILQQPKGKSSASRSCNYYNRELEMYDVFFDSN